MSIRSIKGVDRVSAINPDTPAPATSARQPAATPAPELDQLTQGPVPPRFPWLSRLSQQLEAAAKQRSTFAAAPVIGDNIDKSA